MTKNEMLQQQFDLPSGKLDSVAPALGIVATMDLAVEQGLTMAVTNFGNEVSSDDVP